jgi:flagellar FliL protein
MAAKKEADEEKKEEEGKDEKAPAAEGGDGGEAVSAEGAEGAAPAQNKKKVIIMIAGGVVLLLVVVGAVLYFTGILGGKSAPVECAEDDHKCQEEQAAAHEGEEGTEGAAGEHGTALEGAFLPIPTMIVNLSSDDGTPRYLRLTVQLELKNQEDLHAVEGVIPRVIDQFQTYLRELRVRDLRGSAGIYRLQMELLWRVNQAAAPVEVKDVLFQEILIQ